MEQLHSKGYGLLYTGRIDSIQEVRAAPRPFGLQRAAAAGVHVAVPHRPPECGIPLCPGIEPGRATHHCSSTIVPAAGIYAGRHHNIAMLASLPRPAQASMQHSAHTYVTCMAMQPAQA